MVIGNHRRCVTLKNTPAVVVYQSTNLVTTEKRKNTEEFFLNNVYPQNPQLYHQTLSNEENFLPNRHILYSIFHYFYFIS